MDQELAKAINGRYSLLMQKEELKLSVSRVGVFDHCKAQYKFNYILKLPQKEEADFLILGKCAHRSLELFHLALLASDLRPYHIIMKECFTAARKEFPLTTIMKNECFGFLSQYLQIISNKNHVLAGQVLAAERPFDIKISDDVWLRGVIDRVQVDTDGILHIIDYKTTKNKAYLKDDPFQLLVYAYILSLDDPALSKIRASYCLLRHNYELITKEFSKDEIMTVPEMFKDYAKQIREETEFPANPTFLCNYCSFVDHCPEGQEKVNPGGGRFGEVDYGVSSDTPAHKLPVLP